MLNAAIKAPRDEAEIDEIERTLARALEPDPGPVPENIEGQLMSGCEILSPRGAWRVVMIYDEGDVPRWEARRFARWAPDMEYLLAALAKREWLVFMSTWPESYHADVTDRRDDKHLSRCEDSASLPMVVAVAAHAALRMRLLPSLPESAG